MGNRMETDVKDRGSTDLQQQGVTLHWQATGYDPNGNRVSCPGSAPGCVDAVGNLVTDPENPARQFTYDLRNRMSSFKLNGSVQEARAAMGSGLALQH